MRLNNVTLAANAVGMTTHCRNPGKLFILVVIYIDNMHHAFLWKVFEYVQEISGYDSRIYHCCNTSPVCPDDGVHERLGSSSLAKGQIELHLHTRMHFVPSVVHNRMICS